MKNVMFRGSRRGAQRPFRKRHGAVATALVAATGVAALAFAPSAQAASSYNVMLIDAPANVKSVSLWDNDTESDSAIGCFKVQPGRDTNTKYKISVKHFLAAYKYGTDNCSSNYKGKVKSPRVKSSLSTINFWFYLS